jgi:hypothetical protein
MRRPRFTIILLITLLSAFVFSPQLYGQRRKQAANYGRDSIACVQHLNSLSQLYKAEKFTEALTHWRWISANCPAALESSYAEAAAIYDSMIPLEKDSIIREALIDTLLMIFDKRVEYFKKTGYVLGRKGVKQYEYRPQKPEEAFATLKLSVGSDVYNSRPPVLVVYFQVTMDLFHQGKLDTLKVYEVYDEIRTITDYQILRDTKDTPLYEQAKNEIQAVYNDMSPCDELDQVFGPLYTADTSNADQMVKFINAYAERQCNASRLYLFLIKQYFDRNKCGKTAVMSAGFFRAAQHPNQAKMYYEFASRMPDTLYAYEAFIQLGDMFTKEFRDYTNSSIHLDNAISLCPDKPDAYIAQGDLYSNYAKNCQQSELDKRALYWLATDQYLKARELDPGVSLLVEERIRICRAQYPTREMLEENNLKESDPFHVTCWVDKTTTVRARP